MNIKDEIKLELLDIIISKLEEDLLFDFDKFRYGDFVFFLYSNFIEIKIDNKNNNFIPLCVSVNFMKLTLNKEFIWFFDNNPFKKKINKICDLCTERNKLIEKQKKIKDNEMLISHLPEERKKNIYREAKLKRIINDEN